MRPDRLRRRPPEPGERFLRGLGGASAAAGITFLVGLVATPFFQQGYDGLTLWFMVLPGFVLPAVGTLLWILRRLRSRSFARGALVAGTVSFLLTAGCWAALGGAAW